MTAYYVAHLDGSWRVYRLVGLTRQYIGPRSATPREAAAWADLFESNEHVSPLRASAEASPARSVCAPSGRGSGVDALAEPPRDGSGQSGG